MCVKIGSYHFQEGDAAKHHHPRYPTAITGKVASSMADRGGRFGFWKRLGGAKDFDDSVFNARQRLAPFSTAADLQSNLTPRLSVALAKVSAAESPQPLSALVDPFAGARPPLREDLAAAAAEPSAQGALQPRPPPLAAAAGRRPRPFPSKDGGRMLRVTKQSGPLQIAVLQANGELELQSVTCDDLQKMVERGRGEGRRVRDRSDLENVEKAQQAKKVFHVAYHKKTGNKGVGCLSKLLKKEARLGNLSKTPPREAFFRAW